MDYGMVVVLSDGSLLMDDDGRYYFFFDEDEAVEAGMKAPTNSFDIEEATDHFDADEIDWIFRNERA